MNPLDLHAAADSQLASSEREALKSLLEQNPQAAAELESIKNLKQIVQIKSETHTCEITWQKCVGRLDEIDRARRTERFVGRYAWAICGVFFATILVGGQMNRMNSGGLGTNEVARFASVLDSQSAREQADSAEMRRFREFVLGPQGSQVDLNQLQLRGASEFMDGGRLVQLLRLADVKGNLNLFRFPGQRGGEGLSPIADTQFSAGRLGNVNCVAWEQDGALFVMAGPRTYDELVEAAKQYCCDRQNAK